MTLREPSDPPPRILLVDSDTGARVVCERDLVAAGDGLEAIGLICDHAWDAVLADQDTPGTSGVDVLERAIGSSPTPPPSPGRRPGRLLA